jgi:hypothetical protein
MAEKEPRPTIKERLTKDTIAGTLMKEGEFYLIKGQRWRSAQDSCRQEYQDR